MLKRLMLALVASTGLITGCTAAPDGLDLSLSKPTQEHRYMVELRPLGDQTGINQMQSWEARVLTADGKPVNGARIEVSGGMPQHGHGLPTQPAVMHQENGRYIIGGVKFSMPGWWELKLKIDSASAGTDSVTFNMVMKLNGLVPAPAPIAGVKA